jgi:tetratricopeptide (TPR) repeat protein
VPPFAYEALVRGELLLARGDVAGAIAEFELASAAPEEDPYLLSRLAYALALQGDLRASESALAHAEKLDGCSEAVWLTRGELAERASKFEDAAAHYARAGQCAPESDLAVLGLARVLSRQGQGTRALSVLSQWAGGRSSRARQAAFELAIAQGDEHAIVQTLDILLSDTLARSDQLENAVRRALSLDRPRLAERLMQHAPGSVDVALRARVQLACGDQSAARILLSGASSEQLGGPLLAADLFERAGLFERADLEASEVLRHEESSEARLIRARARRALGQTALALSDLQAAAEAPLARAELKRIARELGLDSVASSLDYERKAQ